MVPLVNLANSYQGSCFELFNSNLEGSVQSAEQQSYDRSNCSSIAVTSQDFNIRCSENSISPFPEGEPVKEPLSPCHTPPTTSTPTTKRKQKVCGSREKGSTLPTHLPFPDRFSIKVENSIANGNVLSARKQLIADIGQFYYGIASHPIHGDYRKMAIRTCERFPELKDSNSPNFWVRIQFFL